jgi:Dynein heavy chain, N-terminal region 2
LQLEGLFTNNDELQRYLPSESSKFQTADKVYTAATKAAHDDPLALHCVVTTTNDDKTGLLAELKRVNTTLETVRHGLSRYLQTKRALFPRFSFVSDDRLIAILSLTVNSVKDTSVMQSHLAQLFPAVRNLVFSEGRGGIIEIIAIEVSSPTSSRVRYMFAYMPEFQYSHCSLHLLSQCARSTYKASVARACATQVIRHHANYVAT